MGRSGVDFSALKELEDRLRKAIDENEEIKQQTLRKIGQRAVRVMKGFVPEDTGDLRRNCKFKAEGDKVRVFNDLEYAAHVNYGHRQKARLIPARYLVSKASEGKYRRMNVGDDEMVMLSNKVIPGVHFLEKTELQRDKIIDKPIEEMVEQIVDIING